MRGGGGEGREGKRGETKMLFSKNMLKPSILDSFNASHQHGNMKILNIKAGIDLEPEL